MNPNIRAVIGEADMHSPTERGVLDREAAHGEGDMGNPEEKREVAIARRLHTLASQAESNQRNQPEGGSISADIRALADELMQMHGASSAASQTQQSQPPASIGGAHVQPVMAPQPPGGL